MNKGNRNFLKRLVVEGLIRILNDDLLNKTIFCIKKSKNFKVIDINKDDCKDCNHYDFHWS